MKRRLSIIFATLALLFCLVPAPAASADGFNPFEKACKETSEITNPATSTDQSPACQANGSDPVTSKEGILYRVSRILALVAGIGAIIMIIIGGFMHVSAAGDASRAKNARTVIISAVIGLVLIAISQILVALFINLVN